MTHAVVKAQPQLTGLGPPWEAGVLRTLQARFADAGITLLGLEGDPFDMSRIKRGEPGRDEDFDRYRQMLGHMGELGLKLLCYNFMLRPKTAEHDWHRTDVSVPLRGGSLTTRFELTKLPVADELELSHDELWSNYQAFLKAVLPAAEQADVTLALHPDDPPLPQLGSVPRLFGSVEAFDRAYQLAPSRHNAVTFCQANFKLMGCDLEATVRRFAEQGRLAFVHVRDVEGSADAFTETWHDEGPTDMPAMLKLYHDVGFAGPLRDDHVPTMHGENPDIPGYASLGHLFAVGYLKGIFQTHRTPYT
ncbi:mannonate dehydratase [Phycisphaerales bacterium AB-hyl4]|uniref:mannonate dehydratase n=1 Tax=Natronomicrosphaera hydrolytica TaxID=3242702 RepID=A0ABV4UBV6_9BACT